MEKQSNQLSETMEKKDDSFDRSENAAYQSNRLVDEKKGGIKTMPFIIGK